ncbi:TetR family transcriptional regulator [Heliobacterium undosum]|uniref:TetR family transcriptional regulator n=1 Tax=Heliomicrobium undosum TaxID=121734 RepID=A0A845KZL9_9FIRM|nr:TetR/AcrR family transcriptional regulator [Heliomicrobium undosum]MZP29562.1 TetR family transcriptional regulator [Heliomicrobium undosum]
MIESHFEKKQALLEAALDEFTAYEYDEASLNRIIKQAGVSKGSFYHHYEDKLELYLSLMAEVSRAKVDFFQQWQAAHPDALAGKGFFELLKQQGKIALLFAREYPQYAQLGQRFIVEKNKDVKAYVWEKLGQGAEDYLRPLIEGAIARGELRGDFPPALIHKLLSYLLNHFDRIIPYDRTAVDYEELLSDYERYLDFIQHGLGKGGDN